ncbi:probable mitochondrial import inner membrane translocase subunit TIM21 isoform X2 [Rhododendron vialii]|uniref:probable mitochondrial import inner membrane translocase subunit TIM21 isoform X2 n=1 Tax=Rhododendron vialii TaxID=182163 RepID=UPI00265FE776|nr:probable mitochondrial import inner membrane translocase subunit TIM21 isoform X2 [Rhododendron vialii]
MHHLKRIGFSSIKNRWPVTLKPYSRVGSLMEYANKPTKRVSDVGLGFSSVATEKSAVNHLAKRLQAVLKSDCGRFYVANDCKTKEVLGAGGAAVMFRGPQGRTSAVKFQSLFRLTRSPRANLEGPSFSRTFASTASEQKGRNSSESRKDISTIEDPFDAPTYNIPEKPVTFTEGASYSLIILVGLGIAAAAGYAVFKELIFEPKEYKIFGKALERIQNDGQVRVRIGSPVTGYGQESRNRAARQRIPNRTWTDEDGIEHVEVNFYIRGPHGAGKVYTEMFRDKVDKQWKFTYLIVDIKSPSPAQLMLESYVPA